MAGLLLASMLPSAVSAAYSTSPKCSPVTLTSPKRLHVKAFVGSCSWQQSKFGHTAVIKVTLVGPNGYRKTLRKMNYALPVGSGPWVYSTSGAIKVPRKGTYKLKVRETYPYTVVPYVANSSRSVTVKG